ncbi:DUF4097 and DUF4098 domain-containing protein YvlB [Oceanobacillus limi]|uniref:DUF4097 and DUF4098 domain-containing protein YvlB n=1 Tax=Oceanobacillus limi TaxID=930131 RepID=A0A1H9Y0U9_9BACI|nr:DUF4097 family beta strand repeat-containing protein [Oceanobacillus limi]SES61841.1 DUF4097 and DUF4098 domain-containing protein YvlB [Oceanobacillus limi]
MKKTKNSFISRIWTSVKKAIQYKEVIQKESLDLRTINELSIQSSSVQVEILTHAEPKIDITLKTYERGPVLSINRRDDSVEISVQKFGKDSIHFFRSLPSCHLKVKVPRAVANHWRIKTTSAKVTANDLIADEIDLRTNSGSIQVKDMEANRIDIKASSGTIDATNFNVDQFRFSASSGKVKIDTVYGNLHGGATSGSIQLKNIHGDALDVRASSGKIRLQEVHVNQSKTKATSGNVELTKCRINNLESNTSSGNLKIKECLGDVRGSTTSGNIYLTLTNRNSVDLKAHSGNITVHAPSKHLNTALDIQSGSGHIITNIPFEVEHKSARGVSGYIGNRENNLQLQTNSGTIRLQDIG